MPDLAAALFFVPVSCRKRHPGPGTLFGGELVRPDLGGQAKAATSGFLTFLAKGTQALNVACAHVRIAGSL